MSCLTHDKRFRSNLHGIINELRNENLVPVDILRSLPKKCCTCNESDDLDREQLTIVNKEEEKQSEKMTNLIERVNREKSANPKLFLSLIRLENLIDKHQIIKPAPPSPTENDIEWSGGSSSESEDDMQMDTSRRKIVRQKKPKRVIKSGTFIFLPYLNSDGNQKKTSDSLLNVAKVFQKSRFISRNGHIPQLEKQYNVRINMITPKTKPRVREALENAKKGLEKLTILNINDFQASENPDGEWVLVRPKKQKDTTDTELEQLFDDLTIRWNNCLKIRKRKSRFDNSSDDDESSNDSSFKRK